MGTDSRRVAISVLLTLSLVLALASAWRWYALSESAREAAKELALCRDMATQIRSYRASPQAAQLERPSQQQVTLLIERAAEEAEIPNADILRITPQQGRRRSKASHVEQPTNVELRQVTLGQLSRFFQGLRAVDLGLQPTSIRLTAPRNSPAATQNEVWGCELVLTYVVFSPE